MKKANKRVKVGKGVRSKATKVVKTKKINENKGMTDIISSLISETKIRMIIGKIMDESVFKEKIEDIVKVVMASNINKKPKGNKKIGRPKKSKLSKWIRQCIKKIRPNKKGE